MDNLLILIILIPSLKFVFLLLCDDFLQQQNTGCHVWPEKIYIEKIDDLIMQQCAPSYS